jgi:hypothetical protein
MFAMRTKIAVAIILENFGFRLAREISIFVSREHTQGSK